MEEPPPRARRGAIGKGLWLTILKQLEIKE
jgi:hypothetical protein